MNSPEIQDISDKMHIDILLDWLEAKPEDFTLGGCGSTEGCLVESYLREMYGAKRVHGGYESADIVTEDGEITVQWTNARRLTPGSPVGNVVNAFDSILGRIIEASSGQRYTATRDEVLTGLRERRA